VDDRGFAIYESVISSAECDDTLRSIFESEIRIGRGGTRNLMSIEKVRALANDLRMSNIARSFLGQTSIPYKATLFEKTGKSNWLVAWHQDTALPVETNIELEGWGPMSMKDGVRFAHAPVQALSRVVALRIHLDPSREDNGPVPGIPGSHQNPFPGEYCLTARIAAGQQTRILGVGQRL